ncbi:PEP-CTERM sorting domain-containing protein [Hwanghaeella sp.]|uniref:VPLPA-CTERM sorting domain-containing protein n=1 Tax=Hwanghaeella sp. TaxID=2605943 RepID=UPI003CCC3956
MRLALISGAIAVGVMCSSMMASAAVIQPDSVINVSSEFNASFAAENTINGSGLTSNPRDPSEAHANYAGGNHWTTAAGTNPLDAFITWGFDSPTDLFGMYVWNHRSNIISANTGYEPTLFTLELFDGSNNSLLTLTNVSLLPDVATGQTIDFGGLVAGVSSIRFDVDAVQSSPDFTGLAEVAFETSPITAVPVPAALPLLLTGLVGLSFLRRRGARIG